MTVKPKLVDLKIIFDTSFKKKPLKIIFKNKSYNLEFGINNFVFDETFIDKKISFDIKNFCNTDTSQKIHVYFSINGQKQRIDRCVFYPEDKKSQIKDNLNVIIENGILQFKLSKEWFACNIFNGSCVYKTKYNFIHWVKTYKIKNYDRSREKDLKYYDIACVGASATFGHETKPKESWPYYLEQKTKLRCGNFGERGIDHFTILHNAGYILKNYKIKTLLLQFGPYDFFLPKRDKINSHYIHRIIIEGNNNIENPQYNLHIKKYQKWCLKNYNIIRKITSKKIAYIKNICENNNIFLYCLYTNQKILKYDILEENFLPFYIDNKTNLNLAIELEEFIKTNKNIKCLIQK